MRQKLKALQKKIGYTFLNPALLEQSMMHTSYINEMHYKKSQSNERLEYLGDAVLELISSEFLYFQDEEMPEGELTRTRASMVCEPSLAYCASAIDLGSYLLLGKGEEATGGRKRDSIVSDALEALIGAIYLDGSFASAKEFVLRFVLNNLDEKKLFFDSKTILQEMVQGKADKSITYSLLKTEGPDHSKVFYVQLSIGDKLYSQGTGKTKKAAEQEAAYRTILQLQKLREK